MLSGLVHRFVAITAEGLDHPAGSPPGYAGSCHIPDSMCSSIELIELIKKRDKHNM